MLFVHLAYIAGTLVSLLIHLKQPKWISEPTLQGNQLLIVFNCGLASILFGVVDPWFLSGFIMAVILGIVTLFKDIYEGKLVL